MPSQFLVDTNILLRLTSLKQPQNALVTQAIRSLMRERSSLFFTLQNASEFWNVCTRPTHLNGLGYSVAETEHHLSLIEKNISYLPDTNRVYECWRMAVHQNSVRGVQVHDAKLAAAMLAHGIPNILTLNTGDFARYRGVIAVHPQNIES